ncbi:M56 family metallopeptidase [Dyadobacter fermentans]|uniref:Peptidase M56 BlaR1 n=1 Tax=Dyadobacter fermentans (strain ATCC 700827 / DSM 18053 / CIP 107007 / KCTC 52180 / NS114) TaxID=471854 RepID=C6VVA4_DYAFD|nr:M56 family metallopeptidase [Dyadobacter fermentans]ACT94927.1 peptidase M56 BlaR1 [Dyadobacter fermentans DSM 18053]
MKFFSNLLPGPAVSAFGWTLIHSIWQGTLLLLVAVAAFYFLRKKSASTRYLAGVGFLFAQVLASVATFIYYYPKTTGAVSNTKTLARYTALSASRTWAEVSRDLPITLKVQMWLTAHLHELVICWLIGSGILLLRFAGGWIFTERLRMNAQLVMDKEWRARFGVMIAKMNISQSVDFRETAKVLTPMVIGTFRPVVLIPIGLLSGFSTAQVEAILAHELAHIRRNDYLINMLQSFVEVIFFFHPAIWWLSEKVRTEREHCCDDIALVVCGDKMSLAHALVKVAEWQATPGLAMAFASKKPLLLHRVQRVLGLNPKPVRTFSSLPAMIFAIGLVIGISAYAVAQKVEKDKEKKAAKHMTVKKRKPAKVETRVEQEVEEVAEVAIEEAVLESIEPEIAYAGVHIEAPETGFEYSGNDTLDKKMWEINQKIRAMHEELKPYHARLQELHLEREKYRFETERFEREIEKIEWKKRRAEEMRSDLMEKRSVLFNQDGKESKLSDAELDKQLADFEQQIKAQEQVISDLNNQISNTTKEAFKADVPEQKIQREIEEVNFKISELGKNIGLETFNYRKMQGIEEPPRAPRVVRGSRLQRAGTPPPPPPAPAAAPAKVVPAVPAKPAPAPKPPLPPKKD